MKIAQFVAKMSKQMHPDVEKNYCPTYTREQSVKALSGKSPGYSQKKIFL